MSEEAPTVAAGRPAAGQRPMRRLAASSLLAISLGLAATVTASAVPAGAGSRSSAPSGADGSASTTTTDPDEQDKSAKDKPVKVKVGDNFFKPKKLKVRVGDTVKWKWIGTAVHDVVVDKGPDEFSSERQASGKFVYELTEPGKYKIVCTLHPGMDMKLKVKPARSSSTTTTSTG